MAVTDFSEMPVSSAVAHPAAITVFAHEDHVARSAALGDDRNRWYLTQP